MCTSAVSKQRSALSCPACKIIPWRGTSRVLRCLHFLMTPCMVTVPCILGHGACQNSEVASLQAVSRSQQAAAAHGTAERCPQCGERFQTLQELLFHVEAYHPDGRASIAPASG